MHAPSEVPPKSSETATATRYGVLLNELAQSGARLLTSIAKLLKLALSFDTYSPEGAMAPVILFLARISVDIELSASMLLVRDDSHMALCLADDRFLNARVLELVADME